MLVPTQKQIGYANENFRWINDGSISVMTVMFCHLVTEQVGQNKRQKKQEMAVVTGTCVSSSLLLFIQLFENIGRVIVDGNQARMSPMHDMPACRNFLSEQVSQSARQLLCCGPDDTEWQFNTLTEFSKNGLQEGNNHTAVYLMHGVAHVHQVDAKMRNQPERIEEQMGSSFFPL
jgi:hypothetical protein